MESAFNTFDLSGSGTVSLKDLEAILMRPGTANAMSKEDVKDIFDMFDEDGNGTLELQEFEKAMSMFGSFFNENKEALEHEHELHKLAELTECGTPRTRPQTLAALLLSPAR